MPLEAKPNDAVSPTGSIPLFIGEIEQFGGAERSLLALARWLHGQGKSVHLLTYIDHCNFTRFADFPLLVIAMNPEPGVRGKLKALRHALSARNAQSPTILASGYQPALHLTLIGQTHFHCLMHDTPALFGDEGRRTKIHQLRIAISNRIIRFGFRKGGEVIVTSEFLRDDSWKDFRIRARIARMGGLGVTKFRRRPVESKLNLLSVCRIEENKRIDWILDSLAELENRPAPLSQRIDWYFDLAGQGSLLEPMRERSRALGIEGRVRFRGFVSDEALDELYDQAHLFMMPAIQGYGIPAIEALQRGIPVLLHRESGVSDILLQTPWAAVLYGGKEEMTLKLEAMLEFLLSNGQMNAAPPPELPTESGWAERVSKLCGYV